MSVEALIDFEHFDLEKHFVGEVVGECNGTIHGFDKSGAVVEVSPSPNVCQRCQLGEYCTKSKAD